MFVTLVLFSVFFSSAAATRAECEGQGGQCIRLLESCTSTIDSTLCKDVGTFHRCCGAGGDGGDGGGNVEIPPQGECGSRPSSRIVGGSTSQHGAWPWQASLQRWSSSKNDFSHICGGSLIYPGWVVTAAHCVDDATAGPSDYQIVMGEHHQVEESGNEQVITIQEIIKHESYGGSASGYPNDIALLKLASSADTSSIYVGLACLPQSTEDQFSDNNDCYITGWGKTSGDASTIPDELQEVNIDVRTNQECSSEWGWGATILATHICVGDGHPTACNGDSGGPLVCPVDGKHVLAGVTSWGYRGCTTKPAVYTRVSKYLSWIAGKVSS